VKYRFTDKCMGCYQLRREVLDVSGAGAGKGYRTDEGKIVVYDCLDGRFPYQAVISGLLRPSGGINTAARDCPQTIEGHCIICSQTDKLKHYGFEPPLVYICSEHDKAWGTWLDEHPGKREHIAPKGRVVRGNWVEVFREFVEDMRRKAEGEP